jgi:DMSO reductase anchor subunit
MVNNRNIAKLAGYSILLMAMVAGFSFGFAFPKIYNPVQIDTYQSSLTANLQLYKFMLLGILTVLILDVLVAWTLYLYFKNDNKKLALLSCFLRIIYTFLFSIATYYLTKNLAQPNYNSEIIIENYESFQTIWSIGLIIFGLHLLVVGVLMKLHKRIPGILSYLMLLAGTSYILVHGLKSTLPQLTDLIRLLNNVLAFPMAIGELGLAFWLLIKGGKIN